MRTTTIPAYDGLKLHVAIYDQVAPKAIVQVTHGALEHKELYYPFAEYLNKNGYAVVLSDNRGHGDSVNERYPLGHIEGIEQNVRDAYAVTRFIKKEYPSKDLILFGHSLGSVIVRNYLQEHDDEIKKLILTGTANYIKIVNIGLAVGRLCSIFTGSRGHSRLLDKIGGTTLWHEDSYETNWVSSDRAFYEQFRSDPKARFAWDNAGALTVFEGDSNLKQFKKYRCKNPALKIASFTGGRDPVVGGEEGLLDTVETLHRIGYANVRTIVYPDDLHAVLFEQNKNEVYRDILKFIGE